jgi:hypothetical protein
MMPSTAQSSPSRSIPIHRNGANGTRRRSQDEALQREAAMADYVDFCFASRLVSGMQKRQSYTHDVSLRYENQAVIDHIIATRQDAFPTARRYNTPLRIDSNEKLKSVRVEDDMIFDMEL